MLCCLSDFHSIRPHYEVPQEQLLDWIARVHAREAASAGAYEEVVSGFSKLGLNKGAIANRGIHIHDVFDEGRAIATQGFAAKSRFFSEEVSEVFKSFYPEGAELPPHLIHVTCTGYVAPSPAQRLVALRNTRTTVTHAYHMGCYGALQAIKIGAGFCQLPRAAPSFVDIVHTELCSMHMHPLRRTLEQLLIQGLFGDGFIKYRLQKECGSPHFQVLALLEELIPGSSDSMTWQCEEHGLGMTLAKEVPVLIRRALGGYLERMAGLAGIEVEELVKTAYFAVHPGGPKILQQIQEHLGLKEEQIAHSKEILRKFGNMSSGTLPHIWGEMLPDPALTQGKYVVSMAFGPGLSISGGILKK